jgi:hypothetical protein
MGQQRKVRTTTTVTWADSVNNNANWTNAWTITEYVAVAIADLDLAYSVGSTSLQIEELAFVGTGTTPTNTTKTAIELLVALDSGFTNIVSFDGGLMSEGKFDTTKCIASFHPEHGLVVQPTDTLYFTVKCGGSAALLADTCRLTVSQE